MSITEKSTDTKLNVSSLPFSTLPPKVYLLQKMIKQFLPVAPTVLTMGLWSMNLTLFYVTPVEVFEGTILKY